jgi:predicted nucleotidyltransferase
LKEVIILNIEQILEAVVSRLQSIPGIEGIVLGGSRAKGTHTEDSDVDIGIYYASGSPVDTAALAQAASELDDSGSKDLITPIGEWGPWINGGGWLKVRSVQVDFLYRDLDKVTAVVEECLLGKLSVHYQPGHPHAFCSSIYMGEAAVCRTLWDPNGRINQLKSLSVTYPDALQNATVSTFLWEADFSVSNARKGLSRTDVSYVAGHLFRAVSCLTQVLFALNRTYLLNEKGAVAACAVFPKCPVGFEARVRRSYSLLTQDRSDMVSAIQEIEVLIKDTERLLNGPS